MSGHLSDQSPQRLPDDAAARSSGFGWQCLIGRRLAERGVRFIELIATMLHLLGLDHQRLTFRHASRDYRLTDVHGEVVNDVIA